MKKFFLIVLLTGAVIVGGLFALAIWQHEALLQAVKPRLEGQLTHLVGSPTRFKHLGVKLLPVPALSIKELQISDSSGCGVLASFASGSLSLDLASLLRGEIVLRSIDVHGMKIRFSAVTRTLVPVVEGGAPCPPAALDLQQNKPLPDGTTSPDADALQPEEKTARVPLALTLTEGEIELLLEDRGVRVENLSFSGRVAYSGRRLVFYYPKVKVSLDGRNIEAKADEIGVLLGSGEITIKASTVKSPLGTIRVSGALSSARHDLALAGSDLSLPSMEDLLRLAGYHVRLAITGGSGSFVLRSTLKSDKELVLAGDVSVAGLRSDFLRLSLNDFALKHGVLSLTKKSQYLKGGTLQVSGLTLVDGSDRYNVNTVSGPLRVKKVRSRSEVSSPALDFEGFSFSDGTTTVKDVVARVSDLRTIIEPKGISIDLSLQGKKVAVEHENITIREIGHVRAPLRISVPQKGGYSVAGPVTVEGLRFNSQGKEVSNVSGLVQMLLSGQRKRFLTANLSFSAFSQAWTLSTIYTLFGDSHVIEDSRLAVGEGELLFRARGSRDGQRLWELRTQGKKLPLHVLSSVFSQNEKQQGEGDLEWLDFNGSARLKDVATSLRAEADVRLAGRPIESIPVTTRLTRGLASALSLNLGPSVDQRRRLNLSVSVAGGTATLADINIENDTYNFEGQGTIGIADLETKITGEATFLEEATKDLLFRIPGLSGAAAKITRIKIPVEVSGKLTDPNVVVDPGNLLKKASGISLLGDAVGAVGDATVSAYRKLRGQAPKKNIAAEKKGKRLPDPKWFGKSKR